MTVQLPSSYKCMCAAHCSDMRKYVNTFSRIARAEGQNSPIRCMCHKFLGYEKICEHIFSHRSKFGPIVYRLGRQVFILVSGVRLPVGLPLKMPRLMPGHFQCKSVTQQANCLACVGSRKPERCVSFEHNEKANIARRAPTAFSVRKKTGGRLPVGLRRCGETVCYNASHGSYKH